MENFIDRSFDEKFNDINSLKWLPWVGKTFNKSSRKVLIVGESHYTIANDDIEYEKRYKSAFENKELTRACIFESPISSYWKSKTYPNIHRVFLKSNNFDKGLFWSNVSYYNFIQRIMDYRFKERPIVFDYYNAWDSFIKTVKILKPTDCIFIGVEASNSFNKAMEALGVDYLPVGWREKIGRTYPRISKITVDGCEIKLTFIQHVCQPISWSKWSVFLEKQNKESIEYLRSIVFDGNIIVPEEIEIEIQNESNLKGIPQHLSHKPILACNYLDFTGENDDAKFLSLGRAQYNKEAASIKIFRQPNETWSRQSEEVPIERVADMSLILLSAINKIYNPINSPTILNEELLTDELEFLKTQIDSKKERIKTSFLEIKKLLNEINIESL